MNADARTILIFPAGMQEGLARREHVEASGGCAIGASSLENDPARSLYAHWSHLPVVTSPAFDDALVSTIRQRNVSTVYTPHFVIWQYLSQHLPRLAPGTRLETCRSPQEQDRAYQALRGRLAAIPAVAGLSAPTRPPLTALERLGLVRVVGTIPGMCSEEKMAGVIELMQRAPAGDVVELGSWWGRSAALLVWLARRHGIGPVLCIDPWHADAMAQGNALLDDGIGDLDPEAALRIFEINLAPFADGTLNYLRARSEAAAATYRPGLRVSTEAFGTIEYSGRIAVLHIDGNHAYDHAVQDVSLWTPHVVPGGWIIFDDYEWAFGDGPRRAADAFIAEAGSRVTERYRAGPSLMVRV